MFLHLSFLHGLVVFFSIKHIPLAILFLCGYLRLYLRNHIPNSKTLHSTRYIALLPFPFYIADYYCPIDTADTRLLVPGDYLISLNEEGEGSPFGYANPACFDCRVRGGTLDPPHYWMTDE